MMRKLAIVSSYNENCGNASYTHVLKEAFSHYVHVDVISLDLFLLQNKSEDLIAAGDRHIDDICRQLAHYDYVNIQFEGGLYGARVSDVLRRITKLINAAPNLTLTMHRVDADFTSLTQAFYAGIATRSWRRFKSVRGANKFSRLSKNVVRACMRAGKKKNVWIKVHTRREERSVREIFRNDNVYAFPLTYMNPDQQKLAWSHSDRDAFLEKHGFERGDQVIGLFGYLSNYKGIETAMTALALLPPHYKLGLFGSQHPQTVKRGEAVNPYLESLFELMEELDEKVYEDNKKTVVVPAPRVDADANDERPSLNLPRSVISKIHKRIRFIGSLPDPEFIEALRLTDAVVLPYLEVGQSMSGVAILGMESGAKMICANNNSFAQVRRYYPDSFLGFDMGNPYELAQKIEYCVKHPGLVEFRKERMNAFAKYHIDASVRLQLEKFGHSNGDI